MGEPDGAVTYKDLMQLADSIRHDQAELMRPVWEVVNQTTVNVATLTTSVALLVEHGKAEGLREQRYRQRLLALTVAFVGVIGSLIAALIGSGALGVVNVF